MERNDMKRNVFISYSRRDYVDGHGEVIPGNSISRILEALENNGITYWIDKQGVYSGDEFKGLLTQAIMDADVFVFVSSEASNKSKWTSKEVDVAVYLDKCIIPFRIDYAKYNPSIMLDLVGRSAINYMENADIALEELVKSIKMNTKQPEIDVKHIKEEIVEMEKEGLLLYIQQRRLYDQIAEKKTLIGEEENVCPVCGANCKMNALYCMVCGWTNVPFQSKKMDEKRLALSRRLWEQRVLQQTESDTIAVKDVPQCIRNLIDNMVEVEGGIFTMGGTNEQGEDVFCDERPKHDVSLSTFFIGRYPITQQEWEAVMGFNPSSFKGMRHPVDNVDWFDCLDFVTKLSQMTGLRFRMPTEAEWEYAARGGKKSKRYKYSGGNILSQVGWYVENSDGKTHEVGQKSANELGIYDMSGNVWEWVHDWKGDYTSDSQVNPKGPENGTERVCRGGGWNREMDRARVSYRGDDHPGFKYCSLGFRVVLES